MGSCSSWTDVSSVSGSTSRCFSLDAARKEGSGLAGGFSGLCRVTNGSRMSASALRLCHRGSTFSSTWHGAAAGTLSARTGCAGAAGASGIGFGLCDSAPGSACPGMMAESPVKQFCFSVISIASAFFAESWDISLFFVSSKVKCRSPVPGWASVSLTA